MNTLPKPAVFHPVPITPYRQSNNLTVPAEVWRTPGIIPQSADNSSDYIYIYGHITAIFPSLSVEQEFYQSLDKADYQKCESSAADLNAENLPDLWKVNQWDKRDCLLYQLLSKINSQLPQPVGVPSADLTEYVYITRELCWLFMNVVHVPTVGARTIAALVWRMRRKKV